MSIAKRQKEHKHICSKYFEKYVDRTHFFTQFPFCSPPSLTSWAPPRGQDAAQNLQGTAKEPDEAFQKTSAGPSLRGTTAAEIGFNCLSAVTVFRSNCLLAVLQSKVIDFGLQVAIVGCK